MHSSRMCTVHSSSCEEESASVHVGIDSQVWACRPPQVSACRPPGQIPPNVPFGHGPGDPPGQIPFNFPLGCGHGDPPGQIPLNFPPGCGPGNLQGMLGYHPPQDLLPGMLGYPLETCCKVSPDTIWNACWDNTPLPQTESQTRVKT